MSLQSTLTFLQTLGLSETEVNLYELLLQLGETPVADIIKSSGKKRPTVYKALYSLQKKKLVESREIEKKIHFRPVEPTELLRQTNEKFLAIQQVRENLQVLLPQLTSQYIQSVERPVVREYVGEEGLKEVFEDIYAPKQDVVYGCVDLEHSNQAIPQYVVEKLIPLRIKNGVTAKTFLGSSIEAEEVKKRDNISLRKSILLNKLNYPLPAEIDVYDDKVALLNFEKGEFIGLIIQNQNIATTLKSIFKLAFEKSEEEDTKQQDE